MLFWFPFLLLYYTYYIYVHITIYIYIFYFFSIAILVVFGSLADIIIFIACYWGALGVERIPLPHRAHSDRGTGMFVPLPSHGMVKALPPNQVIPEKTKNVKVPKLQKCNLMLWGRLSYF